MSTVNKHLTNPVVRLGIGPDVVVGVLALLLLTLHEPGVVPARLVRDQVHNHSLACNRSQATVTMTTKKGNKP